MGSGFLSILIRWLFGAGPDFVVADKVGLRKWRAPDQEQGAGGDEFRVGDRGHFSVTDQPECLRFRTA